MARGKLGSLHSREHEVATIMYESMSCVAVNQGLHRRGLMPGQRSYRIVVHFLAKRHTVCVPVLYVTRLH